MKKYLLLIVAIALVAFISVTFIFRSYFGLGQRQPALKYTGPVQEITIGRVGRYPDLAIITEDKGYFNEYGLEATFKDYESSSAMIQDLLAGTIDMVSVSAEFLVVRNSFAGEDLKIVASVAKTDDYWVLQARKDKNIQNPTDLKGKKIGVQRTTINEFMLAQFLTNNGLDIEDVQVVDLELTPRMDMLASGELDAIVNSSPFTEQLDKTVAGGTITWPAQGGRSMYNLTYTTGRVTKDNPTLVERYLRATGAAEEFVKTHNQEARSILQKHLNYPDTEMAALWPKFTFELSLEQELLLAMEDEARWVIKNKLTEKTEVPNYLDYIYFDALAEVKPAAITIIGR